MSDLSTQAELEAELEVLCQKVSTRLKAQALAGGRVTLKLKRPDHTILTRSQTLPEPTDKAHMLFEIGSLLLARETGGRKKLPPDGNRCRPVGAARWQQPTRFE